MKKKVFMSLLMIAMVSALIGGATFAYFSDSATNENNTFAAGTLSIVLNDGNGYALESALFYEENIYPSWSETKAAQIENDGSLDALVRVKFEFETNELAEYLKVTVTDKKDDTVVFDDFLTEITSGEWVELGTIASGDAQDYEITVEFVENGEDQNDAQGLVVEVDVTVQATQTSNTGFTGL